MAVVIIVLAGTLWLFLNPSVWRERRLAAQVKALQEQTEALEQIRAQLQERRDALAGDPVAIEREMRRQLGYVRPGEVAVISLPPRNLRLTVLESLSEANRQTRWLRVAMWGILGLLAASVPLMVCTSRSR
jgi:cell division protein FtsB